jgi:hypothetical protein
MSTKAKLPPEEVQAESSRLLGFINENMLLQSLLYDLDLMPEQLEQWSKQWFNMLNIADHFERAEQAARAPKGGAA